MTSPSQAIDEVKLFSDLRSKMGSRLLESDFMIDSSLFNTISVVKTNITEVF